MKRREFITLLGGAAVAWPLAAHAQQRAKAVIGWLSPVSAAGWVPFLEAFRNGLKDSGYVEGQNLSIEYFWADGNYDRLPAFATELVARRVSVIAGIGAPPSIAAAKAATKSIPIVFVTGSDPVANGFVSSLNRPGGNVTGVSFLATDLVAKRMELLREFTPNATTMAILVNPGNPSTALATNVAQAAAQALRVRLLVLKASTDRDLDSAFATAIQQRADALLVNTDGFFNSRRDQLIALAALHAVPTIYYGREFVAAGGLISYGSSITDAYRLAGVYTSRILKGEKPADLPVVQPTKFEFVINRKTAKVLGLVISPKLLALADEVIE